MAYVNQDGVQYWTSVVRELADQTYAKTITETAKGAIAHITDGANGAPVKSLIFSIEPKQSGSGGPSPQNIRPITGWTQVDAVAARGNLLDLTNDVTVLSGNVPAAVSITHSAGSVTITEAYYDRNSNKFGWAFPVKQNNPYILSFTANSTASISIKIYALDGSIVKSYTAGSTGNITVTFNSGDNSTLYFYASVTSWSQTINLTKVQIEQGSIATPYAAPTITPITIALGQTVYGGTVDALRGKCEKTLDVLESITWNKHNSYNHLFYSPAGIGQKQAGFGASNELYLENTGTLATFASDTDYKLRIGDRIYINVPAASTTAELSTWLSSNPLQIIFELATPVEISLTPVSDIETLLGENNFWCDSGDTEVGYIADTKLFIERLTAPTEDDFVANTNIASGKYFMIGNELYLSTAAISAGETIKPNTNCTKYSLADALNQINA